MNNGASSSQPGTSDTNSCQKRIKPLDWAQASGIVEQVLRSIERHAGRRRRRRMAAACVAFAVLLLAPIGLRLALQSRPGEMPDAPTAIVLQPGRQILPDGSVVEFHDDAAITIDFEPSIRRVVLQRGEAHFQVMNDPARPFVVEASGFGVRAVGTAFSVSLGEQSIDVLVAEGRVAVADSETQAPDASSSRMANMSPGTLVDSGERLVIDVAARTLPSQALRVSASEMDARLAWRVPCLEFNGAPLGEVVALFNRHSTDYNPVNLVLAEPALTDLRLSGVLRADNVHVLLQILESSYGVEATPGSHGEILLRGQR